MFSTDVVLNPQIHHTCRLFWKLFYSFTLSIPNITSYEIFSFVSVILMFSRFLRFGGSTITDCSYSRHVSSLPGVVFGKWSTLRAHVNGTAVAPAAKTASSWAAAFASRRSCGHATTECRRSRYPGMLGRGSDESDKLNDNWNQQTDLHFLNDYYLPSYSSIDRCLWYWTLGTRRRIDHFGRGRKCLCCLRRCRWLCTSEWTGIEA